MWVKYVVVDSLATRVFPKDCIDKKPISSSKTKAVKEAFPGCAVSVWDGEFWDEVGESTEALLIEGASLKVVQPGAGILEAAWKAMKDVKEALDAQERIRRTPNTANREHLGRLHVQHASNPNILLFDDLLSPLDTVILEQLVEKAQGPWDNLQSALQEAKAQKKQLPEQQTHRFYEFLLNTVAELHPHDNLAVHDPSGTGLGGSGNRRNWVILDGSCSTPAYVVWRLEEKSSIEPSWEYHESICQLEERTATAAAQQPQRQAVPGAVAGHDSLELWWRRAAGNSERSGILPVTCDTQSLGLQYLVRLWGTKPSVLGYQQPHLPTDLQHPDGRPLTDLRRLYIRGGDSESMPNEIVAEVVAATAGSEHFVAKTSEEVDYEADILSELQKIGVTGLVKLVGTTHGQDGRTWMFIQPLAEHIPLTSSAPELKSYIKQVATTIGEMAKLGWRHCDISYNNILVDPVTKQALLADFNLAVKFMGDSSSQRQVWIISGTPPFMAVSMLRSKTESTSSELECLAYVALHVATRGRLPWRHLQVEGCPLPVKFSSMTLEFGEKVLNAIDDPDLKAMARRLQELFFPCSSVRYRQDVTVDEFLAACKTLYQW